MDYQYTGLLEFEMLYNNSADEIELKESDDESDIDKDEDNNDNIERAEFDFTYN
ncbi:hypothetical protein RhiirC2_798184 [Rhizophagus irregularis]|uniref:Uncharacterized protein n=1 Tax=Rhizophagus irregularis TaxID=588596 RepID=A0A2N1M6U7_9GLOM|nr:hypothetical protein RhiirC2_798184 [Rhizophagus irregularis]